MEEGAKRRLVGAAVVVVLLVIFLPMLLEEETVGPVSEREMSILPRPDFDQGYDTSVWEDPVAPPGSRFRDGAPTREELPLPQGFPPPTLIDAPATTEPEFIRKAARVPPATKSPPTPKATPKPRSKPTPAQPSASTQASASPSSWVIQVTSLQERERAYALVQKLRAQGFPTYLQEAQVKQKLWHRVRIGPELGRERIESMATELQKKMGLKGRIQRYP